MVTMTSLVDRWAAATPDAEAVTFGDRPTTFSQLARLSTDAAAQLVGLGVRKGDRVAVLAAEGTATVMAIGLGAARIGAMLVPVNARYQPVELSYVLGHCEPVALFVAEPLAGVAEAATVPASCRVLGLDAPPAADAAAAEEVARREAAVQAGDPALLLYTSGTTADPKGCLQSHAALLAEGEGFRERCGVTDADVFWTPLPLFHVGGWCSAYAAWSAGAPLVHPGLFKPAAALAQLQDRGVTIAFPAFETIWLAVQGLPGFAEADLSALRLVINVGVPERMLKMQQALPGVPQVSCTGSTESCGFMCVGEATDTLEARCHTNGRPLLGMEVKVIDPETGAERADGEQGELLFRGPMRTLGYFRDPDATARVIDADGWLHSGDLATKAPDGIVSYRGRLKDMLKVGGENVAPAGVEGHLLGHPAVHMAQVVGARDGRYGEVAAAFVVVAPGATVTEAELIEHCLRDLATFKVPRYVRFVDAFPMSGTKVQKYRLREAIEAELDAAGIDTAPRLSRTREPA